MFECTLTLHSNTLALQHEPLQLCNGIEGEQLPQYDVGVCLTHLRTDLRGLLGVDGPHVLVVFHCVLSVLLLCTHVLLQQAQHLAGLQEPVGTVGPAGPAAYGENEEFLLVSVSELRWI